MFPQISKMCWETNLTKKQFLSDDSVLVQQSLLCSKLFAARHVLFAPTKRRRIHLISRSEGETQQLTKKCIRQMQKFKAFRLVCRDDAVALAELLASVCALSRAASFFCFLYYSLFFVIIYHLVWLIKLKMVWWLEKFFQGVLEYLCQLQWE